MRIALLTCALLVAAAPAAVSQPLGIARITLQGRQNCPQRGELDFKKAALPLKYFKQASLPTPLDPGADLGGLDIAIGGGLTALFDIPTIPAGLLTAQACG